MPNWVSEGSVRKYDRAVKQLKDTNQPATEEAIKDLYVKWGGLVKETNEPAEIEAVEEEAPKKKHK